MMSPAILMTGTVGNGGKISQAASADLDQTILHLFDRVEQYARELQTAGAPEKCPETMRDLHNLLATVSGWPALSQSGKSIPKILLEHFRHTLAEPYRYALDSQQIYYRESPLPLLAVLYMRETFGSDFLGISGITASGHIASAPPLIFPENETGDEDEIGF